MHFGKYFVELAVRNKRYKGTAASSIAPSWFISEELCVSHMWMFMGGDEMNNADM